MTVTILVCRSPGEVRAVAVREGIVMEYAIERPGHPDGVGDILRGRVLAHLQALAGAFVALPDTQGFLPDSAGGSGLTEGEAVRVRITRAAQAGKGPRLARDGMLDEPGLPALLHRGPGAAPRLAAIHPGASVERCARFDDAIEAQLDALSSPDVPLPGGARATVHPTPALVAIDLDTAAASADRGPRRAMQTALNHAALPELARQIRLRNLSGAILIDAAGLPGRKRAALGPALAAALATDPLRPRFLGFTQLGFAEITRPRIHPPLHELLSSPHGIGLAALRRLGFDSDADPATALALRAHPAICAALMEDAAARADIQDRTGRALILRADPSVALTGPVIERLPRA